MAVAPATAPAPAGRHSAPAPRQLPWRAAHPIADLVARRLLIGIFTLLAVTLVIIHVYFSLLPEKHMYLRAMVKGWITREELRRRRSACW